MGRRREKEGGTETHRVGRRREKEGGTETHRKGRRREKEGGTETHREGRRREREGRRTFVWSLGRSPGRPSSTGGTDGKCGDGRVSIITKLKKDQKSHVCMSAVNDTTA